MLFRSLPDIVIDTDQIIGFAFVYPPKKEEGKGKGKGKGKKEKVPKNPKIVYDILRRISDSDSELMGFDPKFCRPEWMMYTVLPIPPPTMRPSVVSDNKTSDDDITQSLHNIIKANNILKDCVNEANSDLDNRNVVNAWNSLKLQVAALVDNETASYAHVCNRAQRPLRTIKSRHKGKSGRVRNNLEGKRTNHSGRTVITADPNISIRELGIPMKVAKNITKPVTVNKMNKLFLLKLVDRKSTRLNSSHT